ncbi:MAG: amine oxidase [Blastocatellia bacterium]|nr:MAG: amine oxidase [Blastocatellia bacterium]
MEGFDLECGNSVAAFQSADGVSALQRMAYDIIIIGGGHNGLVTACYLAKAGLKTLVLERRDVVGGQAVTEEIHPGFRCSTVAHSAGPLSAQVVSDLNLTNNGLQLITPDVRVLSLGADDRSLCLYNKAGRTVSEIERFSSKDAGKYEEFVTSFQRIGRVLAPLASMTPPSIDQPTPNDVWNIGKVGLAFRGLGKKDEFRLLRWGPMAVADLAAEWFETELLRATIAARGIFGAFAGPWSAGTSLGLLWQAALDGNAIAPAAFVKGGMGGVTQSLVASATAAGAEIRTGVEVSRIEAGGKISLKKKSEILEARAVVSNADPRTTFLQLIDPVNLDPNFLLKTRNYRAHGTVAKVNMALSRLPSFNGVDSVEKLSGRIHVGPDTDYLERAFDAAKYGEWSSEPHMEITIPTISDPTLAPDGQHVMSIHVQFAPYKLKSGDWNSRREEFADNVLAVLSRYSPDLTNSIIARQVITPLDLETTYGLSGGHINHGEQALDQFFTFRPLIGWAQYRTPLQRLYLCGAGTHPGGGVTAMNGANAAREILKDIKAKKI